MVLDHENYSDYGRFVRIPLWLMFLLWCIAFPISTIIIYFLSFNKIYDEDLTVWEEFFTGIKDNKSAKAYHCIFIFVRFWSVLVVILLENLLYELKAILFLLIFFSSVLYTLLARPFEFVKENIAESINQISFFMLAFPLIYLESKRKWKRIYEHIYLYSLIAIPSINLWINLFSLVKKVIW